MKPTRVGTGIVIVMAALAVISPVWAGAAAAQSEEPVRVENLTAFKTSTPSVPASGSATPTSMEAPYTEFDGALEARLPVCILRDRLAESRQGDSLWTALCGSGRDAAEPPVTQSPTQPARSTGADPDPAACLVPTIDDWCEASVSLWDDPVGHFCTCPDSGNQRYAALALSPADDAIYITGVSYDAALDTYGYVTTAFGPDGGVMWSSRHYGLGAASSAAPSTVVVSPDGQVVYVTGASSNDETVVDATTVAYDSTTGAELWVTRYPRAISNALAVSPDGQRLYVAGPALTGSSNVDIAVVAYDTATGNQLWDDRRDDSSGSGSDIAWSVMVSPSGDRIYIIGGSGPGTNTVSGTLNTERIVVAAYDVRPLAAPVPTPAKLVWTADYDGTDTETQLRLANVALSPDGSRMFMTGAVGNRSDQGLALERPALTVALDTATGDLVWERRYLFDRVAPNLQANVALGFDVEVSPDGQRVYVAGSTSGEHDYRIDGVMLAYDATTGDQIWVSPYRFGDFSFLSDVEVSPEGDRIYASGRSWRYAATFSAALQYEVATLAYDAETGGQLAVARFSTSPYVPTHYMTLYAFGKSAALSANGSRLYVVTKADYFLENSPHNYLPSDNANVADLALLAYDTDLDPGPLRSAALLP